jgi:large subunit ribosomal protein L5
MADEEKKKAPKPKGEGGSSGGGEKKKSGKKGVGGPAALAKPVTATPQDKVTPRLKKRYDQEVIPALVRQFGFKSKMQVPRIEKITLNMGLGEAVQNGKIIDSGVTEVTAIAGQKPVVTRARKSIASFKLRQGSPIGVMVTLRRDRMWEFLDRLVTFALPRVRDFKGVSPKAFDGAGNYTLGLKEQIIFPEIDYDKVDKIKGLNISIVTSAKNDEEGRALLQHLGMPFRQ